MAYTLKSAEFRRERAELWTELESMLDRAESSGRQVLSGDDMRRVYVLYRSASSSLNVARAISLDRNLTTYLDNLVRRAYIVVNGTRFGNRRGVWRFLIEDIPVAVRALRWHLLIVTLVFLAGAVVGYLMTDGDSERFYSFVSANYAGGRDPSASTESLRASLYDGQSQKGDDLAQFAAFLLSNNATIGLMSFALGFLFTIPVFLLIFHNGLLLGAFTALYAGRGLGVDFMGFVFPHGVTEIGAILLCGAAGLAIGQSLIFPGARTRLQNLAARGKAVAPAVVAGVIMLFIAALIEGFFRQWVPDIEIRYTVIVATFFMWLAFYSLSGHRAYDARQRSDADVHAAEGSQ